MMYNNREAILDGTQLAADWTFSGLQKFGQGLLDKLRGLKLPHPLLEKVKNAFSRTHTHTHERFAETFTRPGDGASFGGYGSRTTRRYDVQNYSRPTATKYFNLIIQHIILIYNDVIMLSSKYKYFFLCLNVVRGYTYLFLEIEKTLVFTYKDTLYQE